MSVTSTFKRFVRRFSNCRYLPDAPAEARTSASLLKQPIHAAAQISF